MWQLKESFEQWNTGIVVATTEETVSELSLNNGFLKGEILIRKGFVVSVACRYIILKCVFTKASISDDRF